MDSLDKILFGLLIIMGVLMGVHFYNVIEDGQKLDEAFTELRSEKVSLGVDPVLEEKPDSDKKSKLKALYNKYEELEAEVDGKSNRKSVFAVKIGNDKEEIREALSK